MCYEHRSRDDRSNNLWGKHVHLKHRTKQWCDLQLRVFHLHLALFLSELFYCLSVHQKRAYTDVSRYLSCSCIKTWTGALFKCPRDAGASFFPCWQISLTKTCWNNYKQSRVPLSYPTTQTKSHQWRYNMGTLYDGKYTLRSSYCVHRRWKCFPYIGWGKYTNVHKERGRSTQKCWLPTKILIQVCLMFN